MNRAASVIVLLLAIEAVASGATWYVAPTGNDRHVGTKNDPLATLEAARNAARQAGAGEHRLLVAAGDYYLSQPLELDARDNGLTIEAEAPGKVTLYGGQRVEGWRRDGEKFWAADLPEVKEGKWDFRGLVVNGRLAERARLPETGTFTHKSEFNVSWLSSVGGGWERKPTPEEMTTLIYDPKDIPATLDAKNAEVRVYHMWDESLVGVARNDASRNALVFTNPGIAPPGAFGVKKYVVWNTREGLTKPGLWYLDRTAGRIVYWPLPGEDMTKAKVIAPRCERIVRVVGNKKQPVERITLRGLVLAATTTPLRSGGFGGYAFDSALSLSYGSKCLVENVEVCYVGCSGIAAHQVADSRIAVCHVHHVGACGIKADGPGLKVENCHVHHIGIYYPSSIALSAQGKHEKGVHLYRNEVHDAPYTGILAGGELHVVEENLIYRVMLELQDGGGIYCGLVKGVLRGNVVRDVVKMGEGYGVSSYYLDEGSRDCIVERNVSLGVERPSHNHIARNNIIRDNVFVVDGDMHLSFARSADMIFERNTLYVPGKIVMGQPSAIKSWKDNIIFRGGLDKDGKPQAFTINEAMPSVAPPERKKWSLPVAALLQPPTLDGEVGGDEWPGKNQRLDRGMSRDPASGPPTYFRLGYDRQCLYLAVMVSLFDPKQLSTGETWGSDDAMELCIEGRTASGQPTTFVLRGFAGGKLASVTDAGAPADAAARLGAAVKQAVAIKKDRKGWRGEYAIPWAALGLKPTEGMKVPFNLGVYRHEDNMWNGWEGTLAQPWRLDQAGSLQLKK